MKNLDKYLELYNDGDLKNRGIYMSMMEREFKIPMFNNETFNKENAEVVELYRRFSKWPLE